MPVRRLPCPRAPDPGCLARVSGRPMGRLDDVFSKTNLLDAFVDGAAAAGRPSLAQKVRAIRPGR